MATPLESTKDGTCLLFHLFTCVNALEERKKLHNFVRSYGCFFPKMRRNWFFFTHTIKKRPFLITWLFLRGVFFKTPRRNTPDFKVYELLFSHFITWVKKFVLFSNFLARNLNFEYLQVYYHVIQLPPEATIYWLAFLLLTFANFSIDSIQSNDVQF